MSVATLLHDHEAPDQAVQRGARWRGWLPAVVMVILAHTSVWLTYTRWQTVQTPPQTRPPVQVSLISVPAPRPQMPIPQPQRAPAAPKQPTLSQPAPATPVAANNATEEPAAAADSNEVSQPVVQEETTPPLYQAAYLNNPPPTYPLAARRRGIGGTVMIRAQITEDGHCHQAQLSKSSGHEMLDQAALAAVRSWRFIPAKSGTQSISAWVMIPITFRLNT